MKKTTRKKSVKVKPRADRNLGALHVRLMNDRGRIEVVEHFMRDMTSRADSQAKLLTELRHEQNNTDHLLEGVTSRADGLTKFVGGLNLGLNNLAGQLDPINREAADLRGIEARFKERVKELDQRLVYNHGRNVVHDQKLLDVDARLRKLEEDANYLRFKLKESEEKRACQSVAITALRAQLKRRWYHRIREWFRREPPVEIAGVDRAVNIGGKFLKA